MSINPETTFISGKPYGDAGDTIKINDDLYVIDDVWEEYQDGSWFHILKEVTE